ncbi:hypothetical protein [Enterocloster hominis (ex Hitch et al. 2024)]|uniref:Uncharacterized protein n=1 Tax=Enterocloster hominis (ex Hitch et al. 2024) TaxID=1917870 RepID=A0ABV1D5D1_9FIRM
MKKKKEQSGARKTLVFVTGLILTIIGTIVIPPLIKKCSNKMCKASLKNTEVNIEDMEPEIVPHDKTKGE